MPEQTLQDLIEHLALDMAKSHYIDVERRARVEPVRVRFGDQQAFVSVGREVVIRYFVPEWRELTLGDES